MAEQNALAGLGAFSNYLNWQATLDEELDRLVQVHGADAVRAATKKATAKRKGRKPEQDWLALKDWIELDAQDWLDGHDPFTLRTNYFLAKQVAQTVPGHNAPATHRRVMAKLARRRKWLVLARAWRHAAKSRPPLDYFRTVAALIELDLKFADSLQMISDRHRGQIVRYKERFGELDPTLTLEQIEEALKAPEPSKLGSLAGLLSMYQK